MEICLFAMNVNEKGNIGLLKVLLDLSNRQVYAYKALDDYTPIDIVIMSKIGQVKRLQVKYKSKNKTGGYELSCRSIINGKAVSIDKSLVDAWAIYLSNIDKVVYISAKDMEHRKSITIKDDYVSYEIFQED